MLKFELSECKRMANPCHISRPRKYVSRGVILQHKLYLKVKEGCKELTAIQQRVVLCKGDDSSDEQVKLCGIDFCIKHAVLLRFENLYLGRIIKKVLQRYRQILFNLVFVVQYADINNDTNIGFSKI